jgi:hypothetical protein
MIDLSHASVNLFFAIFNEEVFYQGVLLEKQGLSKKEKIRKILPVLAKQIDKVSSRTNSRLPNNYHKVEKNLIGKIQELFRCCEKIYSYTKSPGIDTRKYDEEGIKLCNILKTFRAEEIKIAKEKLKTLALSLINDYAPAEIKNSSEVTQFIKSCLNFFDAILDEKLVKENID